MLAYVLVRTYLKIEASDASDWWPTESYTHTSQRQPALSGSRRAAKPVAMWRSVSRPKREFSRPITCCKLPAVHATQTKPKGSLAGESVGQLFHGFNVFYCCPGVSEIQDYCNGVTCQSWKQDQLVISAVNLFEKSNPLPLL